MSTEPAEIIYPDDPRFWDPSWFLPMSAVATKAGPLTQFHQLPHQLILRDRLITAYRESKWIVECKARRAGYTTWFATIGYQHAAFREGCHAAVLSNKKDTTKAAMRAARNFHRNLPDEVRPRANNRLKLTMEFPGVNGEYTVHSVRDEDPLRGDAVHFLIADELSSWMQIGAEDAWVAARSAVPEDGGMIVAVSTPKYDGDPHQLVWREAEEPGSKWIQGFIPWTAIGEYATEPPPRWVESERVRMYREMFEITDRQAYWMDNRGLALCANSVDKFRAEYPITVADAWALKAEGMFDVGALNRRLKDLGLEAAPSETEDIVEILPFDPTHKYLVLCDPAGSWSKRDYFGCGVLDMTTLTIAREGRLHGTAWEVAAMLIAWSRAYGNALIVVERNGVGEAVLSHLVSSGYGYVYWSVTDPLHASGGDATSKPGWWSSAVSRAQAMGFLQAFIADGSFKPSTVRAIRQLLQYAGGWGRSRDEQRGHFDLVIMMAIGAWMWNHLGGHIIAPPPDPRVLAAQRFRRIMDMSLNPSPAGHMTPWGRHR